jgi:hypothetical protein
VTKSLVPKKKRKDSDEEQRRWPRLKPSSVPFLKSVTFNQGSEVQVIDISRGGILLETDVRLRPQMKIHLKMVTSDGLIKLEGSVLRSSITSLQGTPRYQSAIAFEHPFHMLDDLAGEPEAASPETSQETGQPPVIQPKGDQPLANPVFGKYDEDSAVLTFVVPDMSGESLLEIFKLNDW